MSNPGWGRQHDCDAVDARYHAGAIRADNPLRTRKGYRMSMEARAALRRSDFNLNFCPATGQCKAGIYRFGRADGFVARWIWGTTSAKYSDLPASLRFFAGGDNSVRGYEYKSLGPVDSGRSTKRWTASTTGSLAYEHPVVNDDWWLAAFVDAALL